MYSSFSALASSSALPSRRLSAAETYMLSGLPVGPATRGIRSSSCSAFRLSVSTPTFALRRIAGASPCSCSSSDTIRCGTSTCC